MVNFSSRDMKLCLSLQQMAPWEVGTSENIQTYKKRSIHEDEKFQQIINCDDQIENQLFDYYVKVISKKKVYSDNLLNEFRSIIIPNSVISPSLFQLIIALSASDLIRKVPQRHDYYSSVANQYKNQAINLMYNLLDNPSEENLNEIMVSILMLCSLEIGEYGNDNWINYLKQSCLIFLSIDDEIVVNNQILLFCYRYFTLRYILLVTTLTTDDFNSFIENFPMKLIPFVFEDENIDYMYGCCPKLLRIVYDITYFKNQSMLQLSTFDIHQIYQELKHLRQIDGIGQSIRCSDRLINCSNIYLNATRLYLQNSFAMKKITDMSRMINEEALIRETIDLFNDMIDSNDLNLFPTWTLFIIGIYDINDEIRGQILDIFEKLERIWPKSSVTVVQNAIELIWKNNDINQGQSDVYESAASDWRNILNYIGFKLALV